MFVLSWKSIAQPWGGVLATACSVMKLFQDPGCMGWKTLQISRDLWIQMVVASGLFLVMKTSGTLWSCRKGLSVIQKRWMKNWWDNSQCSFFGRDWLAYASNLSNQHGQEPPGEEGGWKVRCTKTEQWHDFILDEIERKERLAFDPGRVFAEDEESSGSEAQDEED